MKNIEILNPLDVERHIIADMHRSMTNKEYESLKLDIEENGQLVPIITYRDKLVDGRHRLKAILELGIEKVNSISLSNNISLEEVKKKVLGTEMRRSDTIAQKAIRALRWMDTEQDVTQDEAGIKFGVAQTYISHAKKVRLIAGSDTLDKLYAQGYIYIGEKRHTQLKTIIKSIEISKEDQPDRFDVSEPVMQGYRLLNEMMKLDDISGISMLEARAKKLRQEAE